MLTDWNQTIAAKVRKIRTGHPCVHNITNRFVASFTANGLHALGAVHVMAFAVLSLVGEEVITALGRVEQWR